VTGVGAAGASHAIARRQIALGAIDLFLFERIMAAQDTPDVVKAELQARKEATTAVRARIEAGMVPREQLLEAEVRLSDVEAELVAAIAVERARALRTAESVCTRDRWLWRQRALVN
jgi:outer membrane protein TolC